jgi:hypothetical protein
MDAGDAGMAPQVFTHAADPLLDNPVNAASRLVQEST